MNDRARMIRDTLLVGADAITRRQEQDRAWQSSKQVPSSEPKLPEPSPTQPALDASQPEQRGTD